MDYQVGISSGCTYEMRDDGIAHFVFLNLKRDAVDVFVDTLKVIVQERVAAQQHSRTLVDASLLTMPTPYAVKRFQELVIDKPDKLRSSVAIITPSKMINTFTRTIFTRMPPDKKSHILLFNTEEEALLWLDARLEEVGP
ncbi:MAG: hypothetical protein CL607_10950 [Anaerolineaceae bacterium]|nr:hypothetical protein [Anaerolineaceae bacterium]